MKAELWRLHWSFCSFDDLLIRILGWRLTMRFKENWQDQSRSSGNRTYPVWQQGKWQLLSHLGCVKEMRGPKKRVGSYFQCCIVCSDSIIYMMGYELIICLPNWAKVGRWFRFSAIVLSRRKRRKVKEWVKKEQGGSRRSMGGSRRSRRRSLKKGRTHRTYHTYTEEHRGRGRRHRSGSRPQQSRVPRRKKRWHTPHGQAEDKCPATTLR